MVRTIDFGKFLKDTELRLMGDRHPNQEVVSDISKQLSTAKAVVRQLFSRSEEHLSRISRILQDGTGSFSQVMTEMRTQAISVRKDALAIEIAILKAVGDIETWTMNTAPLSSPKVIDVKAVGDDEEDMTVARITNVREEFRIGMLVDREIPSKRFSRAVVVGYNNNRVVVCDPETSTTLCCNPCDLTRSPTFEPKSVLTEVRKRKREMLEDTIVGNSARSLTMLKATLSQLQGEIDDLAAHRTHAQDEEAWARESLSQLQGSYSHLKSSRAKISKGEAEDESEYEVVRPCLLLKDSNSDDGSDSSEASGNKRCAEKVPEVNPSDNVLWTPTQLAYGKQAAERMGGDLVTMKQRGEGYFGRMGVVVRKGVIVNNGSVIYDVRLLDRRAKDPETLYMLEDGLNFVMDPKDRKIN